MLTIVNDAKTRISPTLRLALATLCLAILAVPVIYFSPRRTAQADENKPATETAATAPAADGQAPSQPGDNAAPTVEFLPRPCEAEERIAAALAADTSIEFIETPLQDVVEYLKDLHDIEIQLDEKAMEDNGKGTDTPVSRSLKGLSLKSALRLVLPSLDLAYLIDDEVLLITTREMADSRLYTRTYPVGDLEADGEYRSLINTITNTVSNQTWNEVGGHGMISAAQGAKSLVIAQTQEVHEQVLRLLRSLRAAKKLDPHPEMPHHSPPRQSQASPPKSSSGQGMF